MSHSNNNSKYAYFSNNPIKNIFKGIVVMLLFTFTQCALAQVGVGNTNPQSILDISASNTTNPTNEDGILIPRVSNFPSSNPTASQDGMLIFYTGSGASGKGFYYWNQSITNWVFLNSNGQNTLDQAYDEGGPGAGRSINVDNGRIDLSGASEMLSLYSSNITNTNDNTLTINSYLNSNSGNGIFIGLFGTNPTSSPTLGTTNAINNYIRHSTLNGITTGLKNSFVLGVNSGTNPLISGYRGVLNDFYSVTNTNGKNIGVENLFSRSSNRQIGLENYFRANATLSYGVWNHTLGSLNSEYIGVYNQLNNITGTNNTYGVRTSISGLSSGSKYGNYIDINSTAGGTHYGIYSSVTKTNSYAGYFRGRTSLGTGSTNRYLMPETDGTVDQIIRTDGSGQLSFVDASSLFTNTDDQNLTAATLTGTTLNLNIENGTGTSVNLASLQDGTGTDDQTIDNFSLSGTTLRLSLEDDGQPLQTVNLTSLQDGTGTDDQNLNTATLTGTTLNLGIENGTGASVNLATLQDGTGTDDQNLNAATLTGTTLNLGIENGTGTSVNLASLQDGTGTDNQNIQGSGLTGTNLTIGIQNGTNEVVNLASLQDGTGTDDQTIDTFSFNNSTNILTLEVEDDGIAAQTVDLSSLTGSNTLDQAYDQGGAGAGRVINANAGDVEITGSDGLSITKIDTATNSEALSVYTEIDGHNNHSISNSMWGNAGSGTNRTAFLIDNYIRTLINDGTIYGMRNQFVLGNNSGSSIQTGNIGIFNQFYSGTNAGFNIGIQNEFRLSSNAHYGIKNTNFTTAAGTTYGIHNDFNSNGSNDLYGSYSALSSSGTGDIYGIYNTIVGSSSGSKYGAYITIHPGSSGNQYGIYADVRNSNGYAAYLIGRTSLGTGIGSRYLMPETDGTANQIMATDGSGQVSFIDTSTLFTDTDDQTIDTFSFNNATNELTIEIEDDGIAAQVVDLSSLVQTDEIDWYEESTTTKPNAITDDIYTQGNVAIGKTTADYSLDVENTSAAATRGVNILKTDNNSNETSGLYVTKTSSGTGRSHGIFTDVSGNGSGQKYGVFNRISSVANGSQYGTRNFISGDTGSNQFGTFNNLANDGTGDVYGVYNGMRVTSPSNMHGVYNEFNTANSGINLVTGVRNRFTNGTPDTDGFAGIYTDFALTANGTYYGVRNEYTAGSSGSGTKYGSYNLIPAGAGGTHYGIYSNATKSNSYAGYFLGRVSVGTTTANNYILPASRGSNGQVMTTNGTGITSWQTPTNGDITAVTAGTGLTGGGTNGNLTINAVGTNGLTTTANDIRLGGTLIQDTSINYGNFDTRFNLNNQGDFIIQDNGTGVFMVNDAGDTVMGRDTYWRDENTSGTILAQMLDDGDDARFILREDGNINVDLDTNTGFVFNEQGLDRDFRIESNTWLNIFRVDAGNNRVGIGTATPDYLFSVNGVANLMEDQGTGAALRVQGDEALWYDGTRFSWGFGGTSNTFADNVGIGMSAVPGYRLDVRGNNGTNYATQIYNTNTGNNADGLRIQLGQVNPNTNNIFIGFRGSTTLRGSVRGNGTGVVYNTTSDRRLKTNIVNIKNSLAIIEDIQPRIYEYKTALGTKEYGFIAQELQPFYPQAVSGSPDSDVNTDPMMVDYGRLTPLLTAGIKELKEEVDTLKTENEALKAKLQKLESLEERLTALENKGKTKKDNALASTND